MKTFIIIFHILFFSLTLSAQTLKISVTNTKSDEGQLVLTLHKDNDSFPKTDPYKVIIVKKKGLKEPYIIEIELTPDTYAFTILDDCNSNSEMDYKFGLFPKEAVGFSKITKIKGFKSPTFEECSFILEENKDLNLNVSLIWF